MQHEFMKKGLARLICVVVLLISCGYAGLGNENSASANGAAPPNLISPTRTLITNATAEVIMQAPSDAMIKIYEGNQELVTQAGEGSSIVTISLPMLSKGVHMLTAKVTSEIAAHTIPLPPIVVYDHDAFTIEDIVPIALDMPSHEWDMNNDGVFDQRSEIQYLLARIHPYAEYPIDDFDVVPSVTAATYATFIYSKPAGATSVKLLQMANGESSYTEVGAVSVSDATYTLTGLTPGTSYAFKLVVTGGPRAGESNVVSVVTPPLLSNVGPYQALDFNGSSDYVEIADNVGFSSTSFTIEAWVKPQMFAWKTGIVSKYQSNGNPSFTLRLSDGFPLTYPEYNKINFQIDDGMELNSHANLELNTWYHLAALYDGSTMMLYINGALDSSRENVSYKTNTSPISIGADFINSLENPRYFNGQIGEVRFWTSARSVCEIKADMNNHDASGSDANLAGYWTFNNGATDQSGNNRNGTMHGSPTPIRN